MPKTETLRRTLHPEIKVIDAKAGIVEYIASDETLDSYREVIRADGWRFTHFLKNSPFVDSHDYSTIDRLVGKVVDFRVAGRKLVETVQWAKDVAENQLAQLGWKMTEAGYLKAVSVGFFPVNVARPNQKGWREQITELGLTEQDNVRAIYTEQEQIELSACIIGANPNALARAYKADVLSDADLDLISQQRTHRVEHRPDAPDPAAGIAARQRAATVFLMELQQKIAAL